MMKLLVVGKNGEERGSQARAYYCVYNRDACAYCYDAYDQAACGD